MGAAPFIVVRRLAWPYCSYCQDRPCDALPQPEADTGAAPRPAWSGRLLDQGLALSLVTFRQWTTCSASLWRRGCGVERHARDSVRQAPLVQRFNYRRTVREFGNLKKLADTLTGDDEGERLTIFFVVRSGISLPFQWTINGTLHVNSTLWMAANSYGGISNQGRQFIVHRISYVDK